MKRTDLVIVIFVAAVSAGIAYFVASSVFGGMTEQGAKVQTIDPITSTVIEPDKNIFNDESINPSVKVNINDSDSSTSKSTGSSQ